MVSKGTTAAAYAMLCIIWGSTWLAIKVGLEGAPVFLSAALRFVVASAALLVVAALLRSRFPRTRQEWSLVVLVGVVLFTLDYALIYWGESEGVESGLSAILFATFVFQTMVFAHAMLPRERLTLRKLAGGGVAFAGILLIFRGHLGTAGLGLFLPMLAIVLSATCASISSVAVKRWGQDADPVSFTAAAMVVGTAGLIALSLGSGERWFVPTWPGGIGAILYLALAGSVVTFVTYWWLLKRIEATSMSYIAMVTPIVAVLLGYTLGNEVLDPVALGGAAVTLGGIYFAVSRRPAAWLRGLVAPEVATAPPNPRK